MMKGLSRGLLYKDLGVTLGVSDNIALLLEVNTSLLQNVEDAFSVNEENYSSNIAPRTIIESLRDNTSDVVNEFERRYPNLNGKEDFIASLVEIERFLNRAIDSQQFEDYRSISKKSFTRILYALAALNEANLKSPYEFDSRWTQYVDEHNWNNYVFLSHAYVDRLYCLALFHYFLGRGIYLYIDWMHSDPASDGGLLKYNLGKELCRSNQLLFLRSPNSELNIHGNKNIRPWCAWEMGYFSAKFDDEEYLLNLYSTGPYNNLMLHNMKKLTDIVDSRLVGIDLRFGSNGVIC